MSNSTAAVGSVSTEDRGPMINVVVWVITFVSTAFLGLRIYCKLSRRNNLWWDDHLLMGSWICLVASNTATSANVALGFGRATSTIDPAYLPTLGILRLLNASLSIIGVIWSKTSFGVTLMRLVGGKTRVFVIFLLVTSNMFFGASVAFGWLQCDPIDKNWIVSKAGTCLDPKIRIQFNIVGGVYSGLMDILLAFLPWKVLKGLTMKNREKFGVGFAMSMGVFAGVAAFIKTSKIKSSGATDFNLEGYPIILWSTAEIGITIIAASIPTLRVLIRDVATSISARSRTFRSQHQYDFDGHSRSGGESSGGFPGPLQHKTTWATQTEADDTLQLRPIRVPIATSTEQKPEQSQVAVYEVRPRHDDDENLTYDRRTRPSTTKMV